MSYDGDILYEEDDETFENSSEVEEKSPTSVFEYRCNHCGSVFYSFTRQNINSCIICSEQGISSVFFNGMKDSYLIPFNKSIKDFILEYRKKIIWNPIVPIKFKRKKTMWSVKEVYLSCFLSDINQKGTLYFVGVDQEKNSDNLMEKKMYNVLESIYFDYTNVLLNINSKIDDRVFQTVCDYDFSNLKSIDFSDKSQFFYLVGDMQGDSISEKSRKKISKQTVAVARQNIPHSLKKLKDDQSVISFSNTKEVFVPIYLLSVKYKNNIYQCIMNGQNGKKYFNLPIGIIETTIFALFIFGLVFLISYLIAYFL